MLSSLCSDNITEKLTCSRRLSRHYQLYNHSQQMQKAAIQRSAEGASQVQWELARLYFVSNSL
jgi:hypothetical protein